MKKNFKMKKLTPEEQVIGMIYIPIIAMNRVQSDKLSPKLDIKENAFPWFSLLSLSLTKDKNKVWGAPIIIPDPTLNNKINHGTLLKYPKQNWKKA